MIEILGIDCDIQESGSLASTSDPVSFVVCTKDRQESLVRCLASLVLQVRSADEIIVVDNSLAGSAQEVAESLDVRWVHEPRPGSGWARNRGYLEASHGIVSYLDDDCEADSVWVQELHLPFRDPAVGIVTGSVLASRPELAIPQLIDSEYSFHRGWTPIRYDGSTGTRWSPFDIWRVGVGGAMAWRRSWLHRIGGFDPALGAGTPAGSCEDIDALRRAMALGATICYQPSAVAWHAHPEYPEDLQKLLIRYAIALGAHAAKEVFEEKQWKGLAFLLGDWCWQIRSGLRLLFSQSKSPYSQILALPFLMQPAASVVGMLRFVLYRHALRRGQLICCQYEGKEVQHAAPPPSSGLSAVEAELSTGVLDQTTDRPIRLLLRLEGRPVLSLHLAAEDRVHERLEHVLPETLWRCLKRESLEP